MATNQQVNSFIARIAPAVIEQCKAHGWGVPSAIIAQAGLESAWGTSGLAKTCFNYWGMKWKDGCGCGYKEYSTKEQNKDGSYITIKAKFRKYDSVSDGIDGYFHFIESYSRYRPVQIARNYTEYADSIAKAGWATSLTYANNIKKQVVAHNLTKYDGVDMVTSVPVAPVPVSHPTIKMGSRGEAVKEWQTYLFSCGYVLAIDGIFGNATKYCTENYQLRNNLAVDGIVGPKTWASM